MRKIMPGGRFELTDSKRESLRSGLGERTTVDLMLLERRLSPEKRLPSLSKRFLVPERSAGLSRLVLRVLPGMVCGRKMA